MIVVVPSNITKIECGHHPPVKTLWISNSQGLGYTVIRCDCPKPLFTLSLHHCQAALPTASQGEDGARGRLSKHTHEPLHISSLILDPVGSVTLEIFYLGTTSP